MKALLCALGLFINIALAGCDRGSARTISPQEPGPDTIAYYCGMNLSEHAGPKGQVFLTGQETPTWFASVRDTLAFTMLPGEPKNIAAIFVSDMGKAASWQRPEPGAWVEAHDAVFVAGSDVRGGMGVAEVVPFSDRIAAEQFRAEHGGEIYVFGEVPGRYVFGSEQSDMSSASDTDINSDRVRH
jgi:copper chaperone NosL